jgi:DNA-binding MarR family transcriptional regulator
MEKEMKAKSRLEVALTERKTKSVARKLVAELHRLGGQQRRLDRSFRALEENPRWNLTSAEASKILNCTEERLANLVRDRTVRATLEAGRIPRSEVRRTLEQRKYSLQQRFLNQVERIVFSEPAPLYVWGRRPDLTVAQVAKQLGVRPASVVRWIKKGPLNASRPPEGLFSVRSRGRFQITVEELEEFKKMHAQLISTARGRLEEGEHEDQQELFMPPRRGAKSQQTFRLLRGGAEHRSQATPEQTVRLLRAT